MKFLALVLVVFGLSSSAFAKEPNVACEMSVGSDNSQSLQMKTVVVTSHETEAKINDFQLIAQTSQICAADAGPCADAYRLMVSVFSGQSKATMFVNLDGGKFGMQRYSTSLDVGSDHAFVNCDLTTK